MEVPPGLKYSKEHEWVAADESVATIGITDRAQDQLGEIVYLELPSVGEKVSKDDPFGVVERVTRLLAGFEETVSLGGSAHAGRVR